MKLMLACALHVTIGLACKMTVVCSAEADQTKPRVALLYGAFDNFRHRNDYDAKMQRLGWEMTRYANTDLDKLAAEIDRYDVILASALFRYQSNVDFGAHKEIWLRFMERGGAVILTDCNYAEHLNWLQQLGPEFAASVGRAGTGQSPTTWIDETCPLFSTPHHLVKWGDFWAAMKVSPGYEVLIKSGDESRMALRSVGKGYLLLSSYWGFSEEMLENLWAFTRFHRAGIVVTMPNVTGLFLGDHSLRSRVTNITDTEKRIAVSLTITDSDGKMQQAKGNTVAIPARATRDLTVPCILRKRGEHSLSFSFLDDGGRILYEAPPLRVTIPPLLDVRLLSPTYRKSIYLAAVPREIRLAITVSPDKEKLEAMTLSANVKQRGKIVHRVSVPRLRSRQFEVSLPARGLTEGTAQIEVTLNHQQKALNRALLELRVMGVVRPQVCIDSDGVTRVGRKAFFPIGIYHIPPEALPKAKTMDFNCVVGWGTDAASARKFLDASAAQGLKVILEMSAFLRGNYNPEGLKTMVRKLKEHDALLTWYTVDEPAPEQLDWCRDAWQRIVQEDPNHPVYLVMCSPTDFERFGRTTDVLAIDPYPIPGPVNLVGSWVKSAVEAVHGVKPVWVIPQLHNSAAYTNPKVGRGPTPDEERNMVYQGIICGAKGVIYYPWDDGPCGLVHDPALMEAVAKINAELKQLGPRLVTLRRRLIQTDPSNPDIHAAVFDGSRERYLLVASGAKGETSVTLALPGLHRLRGVFDEPPAMLKDGKVSMILHPLEVRVYSIF